MYFTEETIVYLNGEWIKAKNANETLYNQTMHYGYGVFEGIRSYKTSAGTQIFKAREHYERLIYSAQKIHIDLNYNVEELTDLSYRLLQQNNLQDAYLRPLVYTDPNMSLTPGAKVNLFLCAWEWGKYLGETLLNVMTSSYQRPNPKSCHVESKTTGHYINSILATTEAKQKGFNEALLIDMNGFVAEGPGANFFIEKNGKLYTPPLGNILPGITRQTVIDLAKEAGYSIEERFFTIQEVKTADSAFFTGTAAEVIGLKSLDNYAFPLSWEDSLGHKLSTLYQDYVRRPVSSMAQTA